MDAQNWLRVEFLSVPENVALARVCVASFASHLEFTLAEIEEIKVAISEAVSNCVVHAYPNGRGPIRINARIADGLLEVEIEDEGKGIEDVSLAMKPSFSTDPERMGLGFVFMESFMDSTEVVSEVGRGTRVRMTKRPSQIPAEPEVEASEDGSSS